MFRHLELERMSAAKPLLIVSFSFIVWLMLKLLNGHSVAERGACDLKDQASGREKKKAVENGCVTKDTSQEAFEKSLALPVLVRYLCSAMLTEKLSRGLLRASAKLSTEIFLSC